MVINNDTLYMIYYGHPDKLCYYERFKLIELAKGFHMLNGYEIYWMSIKERYQNIPVYIKFPWSSVYLFTLYDIISLAHFHYVAGLGYGNYNIKDMEVTVTQ